MKSKISKILAFSILSLAILLSFSRSVLAEEIAKEKPTENQISKIQSQCADLRSKINSLRSKDALLRINLGKSYEKISNNLMANFNARTVLNKKDGANLISLTSQFDENFKYFKNNYQIYEKELTELSKIDCQKSPREFYLKLIEVRYARKELSYNTTKLNEIAEEYGVKVGEFSKMNGAVNEN